MKSLLCESRMGACKNVAEYRVRWKDLAPFKPFDEGLRMCREDAERYDYDDLFEVEELED